MCLIDINVLLSLLLAEFLNVGCRQFVAIFFFFYQNLKHSLPMRSTMLAFVKPFELFHGVRQK